MSRRRFPEMNLVAAILLAVLAGCGDTATSTPKPTGPSGTVGVVFWYPDGRENRVEVDGVHSGETVSDVMSRIEDPKIEQRGRGASAIVTRIGPHASTGSEGWLFYVNGKWADRGAGVFQVQPGDEIEWRYGEPER